MNFSHSHSLLLPPHHPHAYAVRWEHDDVACARLELARHTGRQLKAEALRHGDHGQAGLLQGEARAGAGPAEKVCVRIQDLNQMQWENIGRAGPVTVRSAHPYDYGHMFIVLKIPCKHPHDEEGVATHCKLCDQMCC